MKSAIFKRLLSALLGAVAGLCLGACAIVLGFHLLLSCSPSHDEKPSNNTNVVYRTKADWIFDKGHRLDYPIGVDTLVWWEKGRFQIVNDWLNDNALDWQDDVLMEHVEYWFQEGDKIFFWGSEQNGILDLTCGKFVPCAENEMPANLRTQAHPVQSGPTNLRAPVTNYTQ